jgi:hypothetical protein
MELIPRYDLSELKLKLTFMERKIAMAMLGTYTQSSAMETPFRYEIVMLKYTDLEVAWLCWSN